MKKENLLYSFATLAVIAFITGVISYATERHPTQTGFSITPVEQIATPVSPTSTEGQTSLVVKKKSCGCCAERLARLQEQIRKARERRHASATKETSQQLPSRVSDAP